MYTHKCSLLGVFYVQRSSISPAERDKYRPARSPEPEPVTKRLKEEKLGHASVSIIIVSCLAYNNIGYITLASNIVLF